MDDNNNDGKITEEIKQKKMRDNRWIN